MRTYYSLALAELRRALARHTGATEPAQDGDGAVRRWLVGTMLDLDPCGRYHNRSRSAPGRCASWWNARSRAAERLGGRLKHLQRGPGVPGDVVFERYLAPEGSAAAVEALRHAVPGRHDGVAANRLLAAGYYGWALHGLRWTLRHHPGTVVPAGDGDGYRRRWRVSLGSPLARDGAQLPGLFRLVRTVYCPLHHVPGADARWDALARAARQLGGALECGKDGASHASDVVFFVHRLDTATGPAEEALQALAGDAGGPRRYLDGFGMRSL